MTILTANIGYGLAGMDRLVKSVTHQVHMHGWGILTYELFPSLRERGAHVSSETRKVYVRKHKNLRPTLAMIEATRPDVIVLNELIYEVHREELENNLERLGFRTFAWGVSTHYPETSISTLVAAKQAGEVLQCRMPQRPTMGGGAGMAGIRLDEEPVTVFGVHLAYRSPSLFERQIEYISDVAVGEQAEGRGVVVAGDWNESTTTISRNLGFKALGFVSAEEDESLTCPTYLPRCFQQSLDHIFVPSTWQRTRSSTIGFGSDHLALCVEVLAIRD